MAVHQAFSSSSSSFSSSYEVFLSFHGKDVRNNFADHLYNALVDAGIRTFRDEDELSKGNEIGPKLLAAIQQSRISIPIFSENYASSRWCLDELTQIFECRRTMDQIVLPIFYRVEPRDVRNQGGLYAKAFEEHQMRFDETKVQIWKKALREVGSLDGWHSKEDTREAELVKAVVKTVWSSLNKRPLNVSDNLVGIQSHKKEMLRLLDVESDDRLVVGIHGLGGIGKTTIAKVVYNTVFHHFQGYSFIENIQENYKKHGPIHLQNQLIFDILKQENQNISSVDGKFVIQQRFCGKKVLIVLDDVNQNIQAESLIGNRNWFGIGSKIIITSRNKDILRAQGVDKIYEPNVLDLDDSLQLFSHHAFKRDQPLADYWDISNTIVKTTGGLPLALEAIGSSLFLKERTIWEAMLKKLQKVPHDEVVKRLVISYEGLNEEEQQMFLDTACFFIGMNKDIVCHIWDGCGYSSQAGLDAFCARSLVTISEEGALRMHDQLRDLGRQIVYQESIDEPGKRTRIWSKEEVLEVLDTQMGTTNVKGICCIDFSDISSSQCLMSEGFAAMRKLRLLQVDYARFSGNLFTHSFSELRWLSWKGCVDKYAQTNFCPQKLTVLDLSQSEITENWMGWNCIKMAVNLKVVNLASCCGLSSTPDLSANRYMEVLILKDCSSLVEIDPSIIYLRNLVTLDMSGCISMVTLPIEICKLTSLRRLDLKRCESVNKLPDIFDLLISLTELDLSFCRKLESLTNLPLSLISLDVSDCSSIQHISDLPSSLISLFAFDCESMVKLSSTSGLRNLERLYLDGCNSLEEIQVSVDDEGLDSLVHFRIVGKSVKGLPILSNSKKLRELVISDCQELSLIEGLEICESLETLTICSSSMERLPDFSNLNKLQVLMIERFREITEIPGLNRLKSLRKLKIKGCRAIKRLPNLSSLRILNVLKIEDCTELTKIHGVDRLEFLELLDISGCRSLKRLPDLSNLIKLEQLIANGCQNLTEIPAVERLELLQKLEIGGCKSLKRLPDLSNLKNLNVLKIRHCRKLTEINHGVDRLKLLEKLEISWCDSLERLPDLSNLKNLNVLKIHYCWMLTEIHGVDRMEFLEKLEIIGCESLKRLPDLSNLKSLNDLKIEGCRILTEIHGVDRLGLLEKLDISGCQALQRLPDLSKLIKLQQLRANGCKKLTRIHGVEKLEFLQFLDICGCESLKRLADLSKKKIEDQIVQTDTFANH